MTTEKTKQFKVIPIEDGYVIVDEKAPIYSGDKLLFGGKVLGTWADTWDNVTKYDLKVIAYWGNVPSLKDSNVPVIEAPSDEKDVEQLAKDSAKEEGYSEKWPEDGGGFYIHGFEKGYKAAKAKGQFSEDDIRKVVNEVYSNYKADKGTFLKDILKSLKRIPIAVELEEEGYCVNGVDCGCSADSHRTCFKTTLKVKRWIYEGDR